MCVALRKRKVDVCGLQEVRWKKEGTQFFGTFERRYKLWWSGNSSGIGGVEILVKQLCEKVVDVLRKSDRVMVIVLAFGKQVIRVITVYGPQVGRPLEKKYRFYDKGTDKNKVSVYENKNFVCKKCRSVVNNFKGSADEKLCDGVETVSKFTYLGDRLNATDGCETAVTTRSRIGWMKFRECSKILKGRRFSLEIKGNIYKSCVTSAMLYGSEAWCLREKEMAILRRTERAMIRAMCGVKLLDGRNSEELMDMLGMKESLDRMAKASSIRWFGHVLRKEDKNVMVKALKFEVSGSRGRPKQTL